MHQFYSLYVSHVAPWPLLQPGASLHVFGSAGCLQAQQPLSSPCCVLIATDAALITADAALITCRSFQPARLNICELPEASHQYPIPVLIPEGGNEAAAVNLTNRRLETTGVGGGGPCGPPSRSIQIRTRRLMLI